MNRFKLLAMATLLAIPIVNACSDDVVPPASTGSLEGQVLIEGQGIDGITVTLSGGVTVTTAGGGAYRFDDIEAGAYTITISNYPEDANFNATSASAIVADDGEVVTVNFAGSWIGTSAIVGTVSAENDALGGVTVRISGVSESETQADADGRYAFSELRAGDYTVEISGFDNEDVTFDSTSSSTAVAVDESKVVNFEGDYVRTSAVTGQVGVGGSPLAGVSVRLQGRGEDRIELTDSAGQYAFEELRYGDYSVVISGYDTGKYRFISTSKTISAASGETASVPFEGTALGTANIEGAVTIEGTGLKGVTVSLIGGGEDRSVVTNAAGEYAFDRLRADDYSVAISGYDTDEYRFNATSKTISAVSGETASVPFEGTSLRTAAIEGAVTIAGAGLEGVTVSLIGEGEDRSVVTNAAGEYAFDRLRAGDYSVAVSGYDTDEYGFDATSKSVIIEFNETATVEFDGIPLRTAGISGQVSVVGSGLGGVIVTLAGEEDPKRPDQRPWPVQLLGSGR